VDASLPKVQNHTTPIKDASEYVPNIMSSAKHLTIALGGKSVAFVKEDVDLSKDPVVFCTFNTFKNAQSSCLLKHPFLYDIASLTVIKL
jgi:hypothetical protein